MCAVVAEMCCVLSSEGSIKSLSKASVYVQVMGKAVYLCMLT